MPEYQRVRDTSGHEITIRADLPEGHPRGLQDGMRVLKKDATTPSGDPLPPKHRLALGDPLPGGTTQKRRTQKRAASRPVPTDNSQPDNHDGQLADSEQEN